MTIVRIKTQSGLSLLGVLVVGALASFALIIGFRTVPVFTEYMAVKRIMNVLADESDKGATLVEVRRSFDTRRQIDDVSSVTGADLIINKTGPRTVIEARYARTVPLVANVSLLFDLNPSSADR